MKKTKIISSFLLAVTLCLATFAGLAKYGAAKAYADDEPTNITVGVSLPSLKDKHVYNIYNNIQSVFSRYNYTTNVQYSDDLVTQITQIQNFISESVDVIVVMPVIEDAYIEPLTYAAEQGIFIIVIGPNNGLYPYAQYVDFNYNAVGVSDAEDCIANHWVEGEDANVLIVACNKDHGKKYYYGLQEVFQNYPSIYIDVIWVDDADEAYSLVKEWINRFGLPDAIFNCCDENAQEVKDALIDCGFNYDPDGIPVYGFAYEGSRHYEDMAELIADLIQKLITGEIIPSKGGDTYLIDIHNDEP